MHLSVFPSNFPVILLRAMLVVVTFSCSKYSGWLMKLDGTGG